MTPVACSIVLMAKGAPPKEKAALSFCCDAACHLPALSFHRGTVTSESRGRLTTVTSSRFLEMWTSSIVSER